MNMQQLTDALSAEKTLVAHVAGARTTLCPNEDDKMMVNHGGGNTEVTAVELIALLVQYDWKIAEDPREIWLLDSLGSICETVQDADRQHKTAYRQGNVFITKVDAVAERSRRAMMVDLKAFADHVPDWTTPDQKYILVYEHDQNEWQVTDVYTTQDIFQIYFDTAERAKEAIEHFGKRLMVLLPNTYSR